MQKLHNILKHKTCWATDAKLQQNIIETAHLQSVPTTTGASLPCSICNQHQALQRLLWDIWARDGLRKKLWDIYNVALGHPATKKLTRVAGDYPATNIKHWTSSTTRRNAETNHTLNNKCRNIWNADTRNLLDNWTTDATTQHDIETQSMLNNQCQMWLGESSGLQAYMQVYTILWLGKPHRAHSRTHIDVDVTATPAKLLTNSSNTTVATFLYFSHRHPT